LRGRNRSGLGLGLGAVRHSGSHAEIQSIAPANQAGEPQVELHRNKGNAVVFATPISNPWSTKAVHGVLELSSSQTELGATGALFAVVLLRELVLVESLVKGAVFFVMALDAKVLLLHDDIDLRDIDGPAGKGDEDGEDNVDGVVEARGDDKVETNRDVEIRQVGDPLVLAVESPLDGARYPKRVVVRAQKEN